MSHSPNFRGGGPNSGRGRGRGGGRRGGGRGEQRWWDPAWRAERLRQKTAEMEVLDKNKWWGKMEQMKGGEEQEMLIQSNFSREDQQILSDMAYQLGLYFHAYNTGKTLVVSKVPLPDYRADLDERHGSTKKEIQMSTETEKRLVNLLSSPRGTVSVDSSSSTSLRGAKQSQVADTTKPVSVVGTDTAKERLSVELKQREENLKACKNAKAMMSFREKLPANKVKSEFLKAVAENQIILVVSGETGCGKTTQLPQFILEEEISSLRGSDCSIICTQPRRISAISVAARISSERGESLGETVGYQIRLESTRSAQTRLLFCTTGVLLRQLVDDPNLTGVSHLLVDEIHERGMNEDFLLIILRDLLPCRPDLRLILMSATINANLFSRYFGDAPTIHIPGLTFPVTEFFLEDVLEKTCYCLKPEFENFQGDAYRVPDFESPVRIAYGVVFGMVLPFNGVGLEKTELDHAKISIAMLKLWRGARLSELLRSVVGPVAFYLGGTVMSVQSGSIADVRGDVVYVVALANVLGGRMAQFLEITPTLLSLFAFDADIDSVYKSYSTKTRQSLGAWSGLQLDLGLVEATIEYICRNEGNGAILVFLSGWDEISKVFDKLKANSILGDPCKFLVLPLHGSMPTVDQRQIFDHPPSNMRKIVLATNIAESSITIDDVVYVIDCGKAKETSYDALNKLACLLPSWISKASAHQRRGRAGRVQPGVCYRLYPKMIHDAMPQYQLPEILRTPLQQLCLQIKSLQLGVIESFLAKALQPPDALSVQNAIELLKTIGALNDAEELTPLGRHLCTLPLEPNIGKMLLMGSIFQCLNPALTIASALAHRNPFVLPMNRKEEADAAKRSFAGNSCSDHIALLKAFEGWKQAKRRGKERAFCWENFLSPLTMQMMEDMKNQFLDLLSDIGFVDKSRGANSSMAAEAETLTLDSPPPQSQPEKVSVSSASGRPPSAPATPSSAA
ncbi:hypothetical protein RJ640_003623 [Escallonia rubra]|uniref:RNA helicase n=1 Tax=Escallonia rubra TaxID=112253 RepID=A0AA88QWI1_9ASTE|nr:hypothetical protein RJ640_003623 [Escallonia rubra]